VTESELAALAGARAVVAGIRAALVCAVCEQESSWNPWSIRYEQGFYERYVAHQPVSITEALARSTSWGLMQIMGETAREEGYTGDLPMLCDPQTGIDAGLVHLKKCLARAAGNEPIALNLWNGGGNPQYASEVMARIAKYA
jgi:soluble lytic murein transglycosylase-like protein